MKFIEHLKNRGEGREHPQPPWHLHDKLKCYDFCDVVGIPTVKVLRNFRHPSDIVLEGLPDEFVLKPTYHSSSIGVMVLSRTDNGFYDAMTRKELTLHDIIEKQLKIHDEHPKKDGKPTIVEEKIVDSGGGLIPQDYKAYCFQGDVAFILQLDRNDGRTRVAWYDGNFVPITDDRIYTNEKYLTLKEPCRPVEWSRLLALAKRASTAVPTPFASIDMYATTRGPVLGEITLVPGGFYFGKYFVPSEAQDTVAGKMWEEALVRLGR
ncbi:ATP-grasp fold amidoligase family protein [Kocuria sp. SM24M-10]|uniref:ATP-grasp fold amidoligase family protein n=1 Tax=Kocuria sp. SM24M-10 TaxID=1660349 RepID=UPI0009E4549A|nr:ATP-grasp fold amidoligase family protein [Kocuria sp. SM24M-10]